MIFVWDLMGIVLKNVVQTTAPQRREAATPPGRPASTVWWELDWEILREFNMAMKNGPFILKLPKKKWDSPVHSITTPQKCRNTVFMYIIFAIYATLYSSLNPVCSFFQGIAIPPYIIAACTRSGWLHFFRWQIWVCCEHAGEKTILWVRSENWRVFSTKPLA